jgi:hypothetical protein
MRGSRNLIGKFLEVTKTDASGLHDLVDNSLSKRADIWPVTKAVNSISGLSTTVYENAKIDVTVNTQGILYDELIYWKVLHETSTTADFAIWQGSFTQSALTQTGTLSIYTSFVGNPNKATTTFKLQIWFNDPTTGVLAYTSPSITIAKPTLQNIYWQPSTSSEGTSAQLFIGFSNVGNYWVQSFTPVYTGTVSSGDFSFFPTTITQYPGTLTGTTYNISSDLLTEGNETLIVELKYGTYSWWTGLTLNITDTSKTPSISISPSTTSVTEGQQVTFTISDTNLNTATLFWTITTSGGVSSADFSGGNLNGSFALTSGSGTVVLSPTADGLTESESFTLEVRRDSITGTVLATSSVITIVDAAAGAAGWTSDIVTANGTSSTSGPGLCNSWYQRGMMMWYYTAAELTAKFGKSSATITKMRFSVTQQPGAQPFPAYAVGMKNGTFTSVPTNTGFTIVKSAASETFTTGTYKEFTFTTPFNWTGGDLAIICAWGQISTYSQSGTQPTSNIRSSAILRTDSAGTYTINVDVSNSTVATIPVVQLYG